MAEFVEKRGNIFLTECGVLTITVNCEGVMGAGIALEGRLRWPSMYETYRKSCETGALRPGLLMLWAGTDPVEDPRILCFPTKDTWRAPSRIEYVRDGLVKLADTYEERGIESIAMPHLGCSHGGLRWKDVRDVVTDALGPCEGLFVELWEFDPNADDPWFERLQETLGGMPVDQAKELLQIGARQVASLSRALAEPGVTGLATLQQFPGIGEKTLEAVYDLLFRRPDAPPRQQELPL